MELTEMLSPNAGAASAGAGNPNAARSDTAAALGSDDFFQLLITQLTNQDPLEPTSNDELLRQISSIREIELSTTLTDSLQELADRQQIGSASGLIGQYATGVDSQGETQAGMVVAVRFVEGGGAVLQLSSGVELPLQQVGTIRSPAAAAQSLIGQRVFGIDRSADAETEVVEGVVTGVTTGDNGEPRLELDTGEVVSLSDVVGVAATV